MLKDEILKELYGKRVVVSGEALAEKFGVSRNAVWKAIKQLQSEGFSIAASTNKGYFLESCGQTLSPAIIEFEMQSSSYCKPLLFFKQLPSTNLKVRELAAAGYPSGTVVVADSQTAGKGRMGRSFYSPAGTGVYFSLLLRPELSSEDTMLITSMCAVAAAKAIEALSRVRVQIKWVNDLLIGGKKVCGILTEAALNLEDRSLGSVIIGIGINCGKQKFPDELANIATSIDNESGGVVDRSLLVAEVLKRIETGFATLPQRTFLSDCRERSALLGKQITVCRGERLTPATALAIDNDGALLVRYDDGKEEALSSGEVRVRL